MLYVLPLVVILILLLLLKREKVLGFQQAVLFKSPKFDLVCKDLRKIIQSDANLRSKWKEKDAPEPCNCLGEPLDLFKGAADISYLFNEISRNGLRDSTKRQIMSLTQEKETKYHDYFR